MNRGQGYYNLLPYMAIYFFLNGFMLPEGLLFTTLLTPVMMYFLYKQGASAGPAWWFLLLLVPVPFHFYHGVDPGIYLVSSALMVTAFVFLAASLAALKIYRADLHELFKTVLILNILLTGLALILLPVPAARETLWYSVPLSAGIDSMVRMRLFTYEPSYYSLIMTPVFLYFLFRMMYGKEKHPVLIAIACLIPLALSLSFGVIGATLMALALTLVLYRKRLPVLFRRVCIYSAIIALVILLVVMFAWAGNPVTMRLENIVQGKDTSAMGRLVYSFMFARELAFGHNWLFGVGPGQVKLLAHDLIVNHYQYQGAIAETVRIPNAMAEILATYGVYGFVLKLFIELFFFFRKRLYTNTFSHTLFVFLFIYQFTGSFIVNIAELGAWALVFSVRFREFDLSFSEERKETPA